MTEIAILIADGVVGHSNRMMTLTGPGRRAQQVPLQQAHSVIALPSDGNCTSLFSRMPRNYNAKCKRHAIWYFRSVNVHDSSFAGYYIYTEASGRGKFDVTRLVSPVLPAANQGRCMTLWYHMFGIHIGRLRINLTNSGILLL